MVDCIKDLCSKVHINVYGKTNDDLMKLLLEAESRTGIQEPERSSETLCNQAVNGNNCADAERSAILTGRATKETGTNAVESAGLKRDDWLLEYPLLEPRWYVGVKLPRPILQKLSSSDDIERYLDIFKRVARQQEWPNDIWST